MALLVIEFFCIVNVCYVRFPRQPRRSPPCSMDISCDPHARYRTFDGSCNNLRRPQWGMAGFAFDRLLHAQYDDGNGLPSLDSHNSSLQSMDSQEGHCRVVALTQTSKKCETNRSATMQQCATFWPFVAFLQRNWHTTDIITYTYK